MGVVLTNFFLSYVILTLKDHQIIQEISSHPKTNGLKRGITFET